VVQAVEKSPLATSLALAIASLTDRMAPPLVLLPRRESISARFRPALAPISHGSTEQVDSVVLRFTADDAVVLAAD
jgi:hypothetical protein